QAEDGIRDSSVTGVQTCALPIFPAQPLPSALKAFAAQAHIQLFYVYSVVADTRGNAVQGELDTREALAALLRNTGLEAVYSSDKIGRASCRRRGGVGEVRLVG